MTDASQGTHVNKGRSLLRKIVRFVVIFVSLLFIAVGGFVAYAWLGQEEAPAVSIEAPKPKAQLQENTKQQAPVDPQAPVGVSVQSMTSPVAPGMNALIVVRTKRGAVCTITVEYNKVKSKDSGLFEKTADDYGMVSWSWAVEAGAPIGKWPVTVTCMQNEKSGMVIADLEVKATGGQ